MEISAVGYWHNMALCFTADEDWGLGIGYNLNLITLGTLDFYPRHGLYSLRFLVFFISISTPGWEGSPL